MFIYPDNLKAKPMLWLWLLRDIAVIGIGALLSVLALAQGLGMGLLVITVLYAFLTIQVEGSSILDFLRRAACFLFLCQQYYEWRLDLCWSVRRKRNCAGVSPPGSSWAL